MKYGILFSFKPEIYNNNIRFRQENQSPSKSPIQIHQSTQMQSPDYNLNSSMDMEKNVNFDVFY